MDLQMGEESIFRWFEAMSAKRISASFTYSRIHWNSYDVASTPKQALKYEDLQQGYTMLKSRGLPTTFAAYLKSD